MSGANGVKGRKGKVVFLLVFFVLIKLVLIHCMIPQLYLLGFVVYDGE